MPIDHRIDHDRRLVLAEGRGRLTDQDVFGYQGEVWSRSDVTGYDELVDMRGVEHIEVPSSDRMKDLVDLAAGMDPPGIASRFAIVATDEVASQLARLFAIYRQLDSRSTKKVAVFATMTAAFGWLGVESAAE